MSAYDNPTIIKNDAPMAWVQGIGSFAENFTQSFNQATKEREAKEKEARLKKERDEKDSKEQIINKQIAFSKNSEIINNETSDNRKDFTEKGVTPSLTDQAIGFRAAGQKIVMDNNTALKFDEVKPEKIATDSAYSNKLNIYWANVNKMLGGGGSQVKAIKDGTLNKTNINKKEFIGNSDSERLKNYITPMSLAFDENVESKLDYDINNLDAGMRVIIKTKGYDRNKLENAIKVINPGIVNAGKVDDFIKEAKKNGVIEETQEGKYNIIYNEEVNDKKTGEFYTTVPDSMKENDLEIAGIYNDKKQLQNNFLKEIIYTPAPSNAGLSKTEVDVKIPTRKVDMLGVEGLIKKQVNTNITGLLGADLLDENKLRGFMATLGLGTSIEATKELLNKPLAVQVDFLSKPIIDNYKKQVMVDNNIKEIEKGSYVQIDPKDIEKFSVSNTTSSDGKPIKNKQKQTEWNSIIKRAIEKGTGTPARNGLRLSRASGVWQLVDSKGDVYLETADIHDPWKLQDYIGGTLEKQ